MELLAHRGFWCGPDEKNSVLAIRRAFEHGYGIETDIRDQGGRLVISHNMAVDACADLEEIFDLYTRMNMTSILALNVKADGIQTPLRQALEKYQVKNYFVFDMSIPEQVVYRNENFVFFARQSDIEPHCVQYEDASGVWLDGFFDDSWITPDIIRRHLEQGKKVCIVSPELHGKPHEPMWQMILESGLNQAEGIVLCTDLPDQANCFFD